MIRVRARAALAALALLASTASLPTVPAFAQTEAPEAGAPLSAPLDSAQPEQPGATFTVNSTNDPGNGPCNASECTLREAIIAANANGASLDTIQFNIPGAGPHIITLAAALQGITQPLVINGLTQPGASCSGLPADPRIVLNGSGLAGGETGLTISAANTTIKGLVIQRFPSHGVVIQSSGGVTLECNYIGVNSAGVNDLGNGSIGVYVNNSPNNLLYRNLISGNDSYGVYLGGGNAGNNSLRGNFIGLNESGTAIIANGSTGVLVESAANTKIGGVQAADRNVISGNNGHGIALNFASSGSWVKGNYIGTNAQGTAALGNTGNGVSVAGVNGAQIGANESGAGNVISGNGSAGIVLQNNAQNTLVARNIIGLNASATAKVGNNSFGIYVPNGNNSTIGGGSGTGNTIAGNGQDGIFIYASSTNNQVLGNYIGVNQNGNPGLGNGMFGVQITMASGNRIGNVGNSLGNVIAFNNADGVYVTDQSATGNAISGNAISDNGGLGIDLGDNGVTPNDAGDPDQGPNGLQNFPTLSSAASNGSQTQAAGALNSLANRAFRLEFFSTPTCDPSGYGEGRVYLGTANVTTNGAGNASFSVALPAGVTPGWFVTATAADTTVGNQTSEFSQCRVVTAAPSPARKLYLPSVLKGF